MTLVFETPPARRPSSSVTILSTLWVAKERIKEFAGRKFWNTRRFCRNRSASGTVDNECKPDFRILEVAKMKLPHVFLISLLLRILRAYKIRAPKTQTFAPKFSEIGEGGKQILGPSSIPMRIKTRVYIQTTFHAGEI